MPPSPTLGLSSVVMWSNEPLSADVGGRIVLMSMEQGHYYELDAVSSDIWRRMVEPVRVSELCATLLKEYEGEPATIEQDVLALLGQLAEQGLIVVQNS